MTTYHSEVVITDVVKAAEWWLSIIDGKSTGRGIKSLEVTHSIIRFIAYELSILIKTFNLEDSVLPMIIDEVNNRKADYEDNPNYGDVGKLRQSSAKIAGFAHMLMMSSKPSNNHLNVLYENLATRIYRWFYPTVYDASKAVMRYKAMGIDAEMDLRFGGFYAIVLKDSAIILPPLSDAVFPEPS